MENYTNGKNNPNNPEEKKDVDKEYGRKQDPKQPEERKEPIETDVDVTSKRPEAQEHDTIQDAKERWDSESPAMKGQPNRIDPEPVNKDIYPESDVDVSNEELDEEDPDAHKNIK